MVKVTAIVNRRGRIVAAQFGDPDEGRTDDETPTARLLPVGGQAVVEMEVPDELERVSDSGLTQFFSNVEVSWPADVKIPRLEIKRAHESAQE
jgi:hypothetical protein